MQDNTRLTGKVAIVTGAGSRNPGAGGTTIGNGRAIAVLMAARGAKVLLLDVDRAALEETARLIADEGGICALAEADVSKADDWYPSGEPHLPFQVKRLSSVLMDDLKVAHEYGGDDGD